MSTYILIHGSWYGAWCWFKITPRLEAAGHKVITPDMLGDERDRTPPGQVTMRDCVDTIIKILDAKREPVVLVAEGRGGLSVTQLLRSARTRYAHSFIWRLISSHR